MELFLRVGALPQYPNNALHYNVTWSTAGVVNEYCEPCNVMLEGKIAKLPALEGLENFSFEGIEYEAFYTSGGIGSLTGMALGVLILQFLSNGLRGLGLPTEWQLVITGMIIIAAVPFDEAKRRRANGG